jgi:hypothetical protein
MNKKLENYIIIFLLVILIVVASCAKKNKEYKAGPLGPVIENAEAFGKALGCMAAPSTCRKSKEQVEKEQEEITKDFNKIDREESKK